MRSFVFVILAYSLVTSCGAQSKSAQDDFEKAMRMARQENYTGALEAINSALDHNPQFADAWVFKGDLHVVNNQAAEAMRAYGKAMQAGGSNAVLFRWGRAALDVGYYAIADSTLSLYLESPESPPGLLDEARFLRESARFGTHAMANPVPFDPVSLGPGVNKLEMQYFPSVSAEGRTLVFTARNIDSEPKDEDFYVTRLENEAWGTASRLEGHLNTPDNEGAQTLSADGNTIYFAGCNREGGYGSCDIYVSHRRENGGWSQAENLGRSINTTAWESQPSISSDGNTLFFVRATGNNSKRSNIMYSTRSSDGRWLPAKPISGAVNTDRAESSPCIHFDGRTLYFSSNGHPGLGDRDLFVSRLAADGTWGAPENLGYPINSLGDEFSMVVAPDGRTAYYASDRDREPNHMHLYQFTLPEESRALPIMWVQIKVVDERHYGPVQADIEIVNLETREALVSGKADVRGKFSVSLPVFSDYALNAVAKDYLMYSEHFTLKEEEGASVMEMTIYLKKLTAGGSTVLRNIFFSTDSYELRDESRVELDRLVEFLKANPTLRLRIDGHTDSQGNAAYNETLSLNRSKSVREYLVNAGINADRLEVKGFGQNVPIDDNSTAEGRQMNRRTEITILNL